MPDKRRATRLNRRKYTKRTRRHPYTAPHRATPPRPLPPTHTRATPNYRRRRTRARAKTRPAHGCGHWRRCSPAFAVGAFHYATNQDHDWRVDDVFLWTDGSVPTPYLSPAGLSPSSAITCLVQYLTCICVSLCIYLLSLISHLISSTLRYHTTTTTWPCPTPHTFAFAQDTRSTYMRTACSTAHTWA